MSSGAGSNGARMAHSRNMCSELIADALKNGCTNIIIGLGGSATNDGGCGAAAALGVKFFDKEGKSFIPAGGTLKNIERIDMTGLNPLVKKVRFTTMCDIDNPLFGKTGAAYIFAPQKGADPGMVSIPFPGSGAG